MIHVKADYIGFRRVEASATATRIRIIRQPGVVMGSIDRYKGFSADIVRKIPPVTAIDRNTGENFHQVLIMLPGYEWEEGRLTP